MDSVEREADLSGEAGATYVAGGVTRPADSPGALGFGAGGEAVAHGRGDSEDLLRIAHEALARGPEHQALSKPAAARYVEDSGMAVMVKQPLLRVDSPQFRAIPAPPNFCPSPTQRTT